MKQFQLWTRDCNPWGSVLLSAFDAIVRRIYSIGIRIYLSVQRSFQLSNIFSICLFLTSDNRLVPSNVPILACPALLGHFLYPVIPYLLRSPLANNYLSKMLYDRDNDLLSVYNQKKVLVVAYFTVWIFFFIIVY